MLIAYCLMLILSFMGHITITSALKVHDREQRELVFCFNLDTDPFSHPSSLCSHSNILAFTFGLNILKPDLSNTFL